MLSAELSAKVHGLYNFLEDVKHSYPRGVHSKDLFRDFCYVMGNSNYADILYTFSLHADAFDMFEIEFKQGNPNSIIYHPRRIVLEFDNTVAAWFNFK